MLENIIVILVIGAILGLAVWYVIRAKKKGVKCIGCPSGTKCTGHCSGCSGNCGCGGKANHSQQ